MQREDQEPIIVDIDHPPPSPERQIRSPPMTEFYSQPQPPATPLSLPAVRSRLQAWSTPAFLKRDRLSTRSYFGSDYDPFDEDHFRDNNRRKKTKFGRASNQWKFTEQSSSPESAVGSASPVAGQPTLDERPNGVVKNHVSVAQPQAPKGVDIEHSEILPEDRLASHEPLVDIGVQVGDNLMSPTVTEIPAHNTPDAVISRNIQPRRPMSASEDSVVSISRQDTDTSEHLKSVEDALRMEIPADEPIVPTHIDTSTADRGAKDTCMDHAADSHLSNMERQGSVVSSDRTSVAGQRDRPGLEKSEEGNRSIKHKDFLYADRAGGDRSPRLDRYSVEETFDERQLRDQRSLSPILGDNRILHVQQHPWPSDHGPQLKSSVEGRSDHPPTAQDEGEVATNIEKTEIVNTLILPAQIPSAQLFDQPDVAIDEKSPQEIPGSYPTQVEKVTLVEDHSTTSLPIDEVSRTSPRKQTILGEGEESEDISSQSPSPVPGQVVMFSSSPPQEITDLGDDRLAQEGYVDSEIEEHAQSRKTASEMLSDDDQEGYSEYDLIMDDERRRYLADTESNEIGMVSESDEEEHYGNEIFEAEDTGDELEDPQDLEQQETTAALHSSRVEIITIDSDSDSDSGDIDVAQSQSDGAINSLFPNIKGQSHLKDLLPRKQNEGLPYVASPPTLPEIIADSQGAVDIGETENDVESATTDAEELEFNSPDTARSGSDLDIREELQAFADQAEAKERSRPASASPEIALEDPLDPRLKNKALTPIDTQPRDEFSEASNVSLRSLRETHDLPTPQPTQSRSSDIMLPATLRPSSPTVRSSSPPAALPPPSLHPPDDEPTALVEEDLVDHLRRLKNEIGTPLKASPRPLPVSNIPASISPWFAPKNFIGIVPDSRSQSEAESEESDVESSEEELSVVNIEEEEEKKEEEVPSSSPEDAFQQPTSKPTIASPSLIPTPPTGLRTSHAYYAPLSTLQSYFNDRTSTLSVVLGSTPIARANSSPRDFYTTLFLADPSTLHDRPTPLAPDPAANTISSPAIMFARLFRPSRPSLPQNPKPGDILLLRSCTVTSYARTPSLLSTNSSAWALFSHGHSEPAIAGPPVEFGAEECCYVRGLWEWWDQLSSSIKESVLAEVSDKVTKLKEKDEREKAKGRRLKGMGLRLAPGSVIKGKHELRDGKEYSDDVVRPRTPRKPMGVRHELRDGKVWVDGESPRSGRASL